MAEDEDKTQEGQQEEGEGTTPPEEGGEGTPPDTTPTVETTPPEGDQGKLSDDDAAPCSL